MNPWLAATLGVFIGGTLMSWLHGIMFEKNIKHLRASSDEREAKLNELIRDWEKLTGRKLK